MKKIIVGYDGSENGRRALERAAALTGKDGELTVVSVVAAAPTTGSRGPSTTPVVLEAAEHKRMLDEAASVLAGRGLSVETVEAFGDAGHGIVHEADQRGADLIVVGTRGRNVVERLLLGSVSSKVVQNAHCDVLVVR